MTKYLIYNKANNTFDIYTDVSQVAAALEIPIEGAKHFCKLAHDQPVKIAPSILLGIATIHKTRRGRA